MSAKDINQTFSAILRKPMVNLLLDAILFLRTNGFETRLVICVNADVRTLERTRERQSTMPGVAYQLLASRIQLLRN